MKAEESPASGPSEMSVPLKISSATAPRPFPAAATRPQLPPVMSEEILDYYGWVFCQGGSANLDMTFEQFLAVSAKLGAWGCLRCERLHRYRLIIEWRIL